MTFCFSFNKQINYNQIFKKLINVNIAEEEHEPKRAENN